MGKQTFHNRPEPFSCASRPFLVLFLSCADPTQVRNSLLPSAACSAIQTLSSLGSACLQSVPDACLCRLRRCPVTLCPCARPSRAMAGQYRRSAALQQAAVLTSPDAVQWQLAPH